MWTTHLARNLEGPKLIAVGCFCLQMTACPNAWFDWLNALKRITPGILAFWAFNNSVTMRNHCWANVLLLAHIFFIKRKGTKPVEFGLINLVSLLEKIWKDNTDATWKFLAEAAMRLISRQLSIFGLNVRIRWRLLPTYLKQSLASHVQDWLYLDAHPIFDI